VNSFIWSNSNSHSFRWFSQTMKHSTQRKERVNYQKTRIQMLTKTYHIILEIKGLSTDMSRCSKLCCDKAY